MKNTIIDGVNYGPLVVCECEGVKILAAPHVAEAFKLKTFPNEPILEFVEHLSIRVNISYYVEYWIWCFKKEDLAPVAKFLSGALQKVVGVKGAVRFLAEWENGEQIGNTKKLSHFYPNISQEEDEKHSF